MTDEPGPETSHGPRTGRWERRRVIELGLALLVVAATSVHLLRFVGIAWRVSLWHDELFSVVHYSGQGPGHVVTHYGSANNHVFFNLVNALTPGSGSVDPARARWWSIVAVLVMQGGILVTFWRRGRFLAGAVLFGLLATSPEWLDLALQARGYGFLGLAALVSCATIWRCLESPSTAPLVVLGLVTVAGTWTVPSYLLFAGPLWLLLLAALRRRDVLGAGVATAVGVALVYLPILGEVRREMSTYEEQWGRSYTGLGSLAETVGTYLLRPSLFGGMALGSALTVAVLAGALIAAVALPLPARVRPLVLVLLGSTVAFLAANLWLGTAVLRTTAFVTVPLAFSLVVLVDGAVAVALAGRRDGASGAAGAAASVAPLATAGAPSRGAKGAGTAVVGMAMAAVVVLAVSVLVVQGVGAPKPLQRLPLQDWQAVGRYVDRTFPDGTGVVVNGPAAAVDDIEPYLRWVPSETGGVRAPAFTTGRSVLIDSAATGSPSFDVAQVAAVWSEARFPQRIGSYLRVLAAAPAEARVGGVAVAGRAVDLGPLTDRRRATGVTASGPTTTVRIAPPPGQVTRSVVVVAGADLTSVRSVVVVVDGRAVPVVGDDVHRSGPSLTVAVGDRRVDAVEVTIAAGGGTAGAGGPGVDVREVWTHPARLTP